MRREARILKGVSDMRKLILIGLGLSLASACLGIAVAPKHRLYERRTALLVKYEGWTTITLAQQECLNRPKSRKLF